MLDAIARLAVYAPIFAAIAFTPVLIVMGTLIAIICALTGLPLDDDAAFVTNVITIATSVAIGAAFALSWER